MSLKIDVIDATNDQRRRYHTYHLTALPRVGETLLLDGWPQVRVLEVQHRIVSGEQFITLLVQEIE